MTEKEINEFADGLEYTNGIYGFKQGVKLQKQKQDEFAIGFGEFMLTKIFVKKSVKELLEIYKKKGYENRNKL